MIPLLASAQPFDPLPKMAGVFTDSRLDELSGMAASARSDGRYWVHNDSGNGARLYAVNEAASIVGEAVVDRLKPVDWEDIAAFTEKGVPYLVLGDVGDNGGVRRTSELVVIREPDLATDSGADNARRRVAIERTITYRFPDAPHDVEAIGVDTASGQVLLVTKRTQPPQVWAVPLHPPAGSGVLEARLLGPLALPPERDGAMPKRRTQPRRPTGMSLSRDGALAAVLTYDAVWLYERKPGQDWGTAFAQAPRELPFALAPQAEAIAFSADGRTIFVTGEHWPAALIRFDAR
ncbi:hypothetical protein [Tahibacter amnicola]|uniref:Uncharacterized protein n=1 Tax=Tahibacter amnicola TaxID=2976241 RepID=A0ABY6BIR2_9GAMM|nr:hypothetical protein [Tahibacter amnicola]UXI69903.1 hypothetical protein N4264_09830 [Tahibacter amnicola]